ncbi:type I-E CRISPR-associated protein Cas5/CasD [Limosilactobacillus sp.]|uniref:type I-E CRISPR-associated protein Cas5/CasD n=1 Tax=Limosilactobacillus sp. TaxID=2773925 RepID=UPI00345E186C
MKTLIIKLAGPFQSYGNEATFNRRTIYHYPSKSAVIGIIAAALGYHRDNPDILKLNNIQYGVRIDQPGTIMTDFQIVKYNIKKSPKITYRDYLQDAVFVVGIAGDDALISKIEKDLHHPHFQLYLGRRANVPAGLLLTSLMNESNLVDVLAHYPWQASVWYQKKQHSATYSAEVIVDENLLNNKLNYFVKDNVGNFNQSNRFHTYRSVSSMSVHMTNPYYHPNDSTHDVMSFI